jgi:hypothetical protein
LLGLHHEFVQLLRGHEFPGQKFKSLIKQKGDETQYQRIRRASEFWGSRR